MLCGRLYLLFVVFEILSHRNESIRKKLLRIDGERVDQSDGKIIRIGDHRKEQMLGSYLIGIKRLCKFLRKIEYALDLRREPVALPLQRFREVRSARL